LAAAEGVVVPLAGNGDLQGAALKGAIVERAGALQGAARALRERGLTLAVENQPGTLVASPAALQLVGVHAPGVRLAVTLSPLDPDEQPWDVTLENLGDRPIRVALGGGDDDGWDGPLSALDRVAFSGRVSVSTEAGRRTVERRYETLVTRP